MSPETPAEAPQPSVRAFFGGFLLYLPMAYKGLSQVVREFYDVDL